MPQQHRLGYLLVDQYPAGAQHSLIFSLRKHDATWIGTSLANQHLGDARLAVEALVQGFSVLIQIKAYARHARLHCSSNNRYSLAHHDPGIKRLGNNVVRTKAKIIKTINPRDG